MPIIVFDIDDCICTKKSHYTEEAEQKIRKINHECPALVYIAENGEKHLHIFIPYFDILLNYLIEAGARIVFFSSAIEHRNINVIPELLGNILGKEKYEKLKEDGQFDIFSRHHTREGGKGGGEGNRVKDLTIVLR
jgi:hypothetical protein